MVPGVILSYLLVGIFGNLEVFERCREEFLK